MVPMRLTVPTAITSRSTLTHHRRRQWSKASTMILFLLPGMAMILVFVLYPEVQAIRYSLYRWNGLVDLTDFVGLRNFQLLAHDPIFLQAVKNNLIIAVLSV